MIRRSGAATKTKHSDQLRSMHSSLSLLPLIALEDTKCGCSIALFRERMDGVEAGGKRGVTH
eukprot:scaffold7470_cov84-Skeletonema_dohrnii-CCMP3373.AAC.14